MLGNGPDLFREGRPVFVLEVGEGLGEAAGFEEGHALELGDAAAGVGDDGVGDAEAGGLLEAVVELGDGADFAA